MSLIDSIDAALADAAARQAKPFRLELRLDQIEALRAAGRLGAPPERWAAALGGYNEIPVYEATRESELMAQSDENLRALHLPISS